MIDRRFEAIENDENQELSKMLACAEQHLTCVEFGRKLLYMASQGRADQSFLLARAEVSYGLQSQCYSVIAGKHIRKRTQQRTWIQPGMVVEVTVENSQFPGQTWHPRVCHGSVRGLRRRP